MKNNSQLRIHIVNVGHGDSILVELPDLVEGVTRKPRFGLVDAGGSDKDVKNKTLEYLKAFLKYRIEDDDSEYCFEFICLSHPHKDHLFGMMPVLDYFCEDGPGRYAPRQFWDCGFRYNTTEYLNILKFIVGHPEIQFVRVASATEFHFGDVEVLVLAPSIDLRNRYDTYGVEPNDASIVLRVSFGKGVAILTGDAQFDSWGKVVEEFPRKKHLTYPKIQENNKYRPDMRDPTHADLVFLSQENQLDCDLLKVSHHGSKHGTSFEFVEKLGPRHFVISCDDDSWYSSHKSKGAWVGKFPHPITRLVIGEQADLYKASSPTIPSLDDAMYLKKVAVTAKHGTVIYSIASNGKIERFNLSEQRGQNLSPADLVQTL